MFNNVLIALAGVDGDSFYFDNCGYPKSILRATAAKDCHPAEVEALQRVTECGALVNVVNSFKYPSGLYTDALKFIITQVVEEYLDDVVHCEREIVPSTDFYSLTQLETVFSAHLLRLEFIHFFLTYVLEKYHGVAILGWLIKSVVGDPSVRQLVLRLTHALHIVFVNQLRSWMIQGELYDPFSEFIIVPSGECNESKKRYKLIDATPEFISDKVLDMIYEIGNLKYMFDGLNRCTGSKVEMLVQESLLNFPQILISDSFKIEIIVKEIHKSLSQDISNFLREKGVSRTLSILRASFLGGRGDLIISLHESFKFMRLEEVTETIAILDELDMDSFQIISDHEQDELEFKMKLWYKVPKELTIFLTLDDITRYSNINKFLVNVKFCQTQANNLFYSNALTKKEILLKRRITEFINSFWSYLQMDVISIKYSDLITSMDKLTYHGMLQMHKKTLNDIETGCFLHNAHILKRINNLITIIHRLSELMTGSRNFNYSETLEDLSKNFSKDFTFLLQVFAGIPEASSLLCRLNFNTMHKHP